MDLSKEIDIAKSVRKNTKLFQTLIHNVFSTNKLGNIRI